MASKAFPATAAMDEFPPYDQFYLRVWAQDLKYHFPFLDEKSLTHPYQMFYYIWKLSYLFGLQYADHSLSFENLLCDPDKELNKMLSIVNIRHYQLDLLLSLIEQGLTKKWPIYADAAWFSQHETLCETVLADFLAAG